MTGDMISLYHISEKKAAITMLENRREREMAAIMHDKM